MKWLLTFSILVLGDQSAIGQAPSARAGSPVLRKLEPDDSRQMTLPGSRPANARAGKLAAPAPPPAAPAIPRKTFVPQPRVEPAIPSATNSAPPLPSVAPEVPLPVPNLAALKELTASSWDPPSFHDPVIESTPSPEPPGVPFTVPAAPGSVAGVPLETADPPRIEPPPAPAPLPPDFVAESALFLQEKIGRWNLEEVRALLGEPRRQRASVGDHNLENGQIYAFPDPTGRYRELELDFESGKGILRTVFVYPVNLTWSECRRLFSGDFQSSKANKGRTFYSYRNRRLDVLVDPEGQVVSLGLY